ncbi:hypothetical protein C8F01DRAFT_1134652 [Mycena amicta]|nr:hypothetical protein C8F01DRAFT_1134652 [Mycena amicta]
MAENPAAGDGNGGPPAGGGGEAPPGGGGGEDPPGGERNGEQPEGGAPPDDDDVPMGPVRPPGIINDDQRFDELYTGDLIFSIDHPGRTMTQSDLERNQRPENLNRIRNNAYSTIAVLPDKKSATALGSRSAVRAALARGIATLPNSNLVEVYQAAPAIGNAADATSRPHAYLAIEANAQLRSAVDRRWIHFPGDASTSISAAFISLPIATPPFTAIYTGVDDIPPDTILQAIGESCLRNSDLIAAVLDAASSPGSLIVGDYSVPGLIAGILRNSRTKKLTHRATQLLALYLLPVTTDLPRTRAIQRIVAKFTVPILGAGDVTPIDHYEQDCELARSEEYTQRNGNGNVNDTTNTSDLAPAMSAPIYRGGGRGRGGDRGGRGYGRGQGYHPRGYY